MIDVRGINKDYSNGRGIFDINVSLPKSGIVAVSGKSGSGKTTFLNLLLEIIKPTSGEIAINGEALSFEDVNSKGYFACVFQENSLFEYLTLRENMLLFSDSDYKIKNALSALGIAKYTDTEVSKLSGGEKKRASIAAAILGENPVILADEPTSGLDARNARNIMEILKKLSDDRLVIVVTHDTCFRNEFADRIITLDGGRIINDAENVGTGEGKIAVEDDEAERDEKKAYSDTEVLRRGENVKRDGKSKEAIRKFNLSFIMKTVSFRIRSSILRNLISLAAFVIIGVLAFFTVGFVTMDNTENLISSAEKGGISRIIERNANGNSLSPEICKRLESKYEIYLGYLNAEALFYADNVFVDEGFPVGKVSMTEYTYSKFLLSGKIDGGYALIGNKNYEIYSIKNDDAVLGKEKYKDSICMNEQDADDIMSSFEINTKMRIMGGYFVGVTLKRGSALQGNDTIVTVDLAERIAEEDILSETLGSGRPLATDIELYFSFDKRFSYDVNIVSVDTDNEQTAIYVSDERYASFLKSYFGYSAFIDNDNTKGIKDMISGGNLIIDVEGASSFETYENMKESYLWLYILAVAIVLVAYSGLVIGAMRHSFIANRRNFLLMKTLNSGKRDIAAIGALFASFEIVGGYIISTIISAIVFAILKATLFTRYLIALNFASAIAVFTVVTAVTAFASALSFLLLFSKRYDVNDMRTCD